MLVKFKSKAAAEVMMYEEHAKRILDLLHKDAKQGVITAAETDHAIKLLENEIVDSKAHIASEAVERDIVAHHNEHGDDNEHEDPQPVSFSSRAYPLLEMLRAARAEKADILWGVLP
jgi:predicted LPLAT superfamily acyltransferase